MKKPSPQPRQAGFAHAGLIILFLVLASAGLIGWRVWQNNRPGKEKVNLQNASHSDPSEGGKYLAIKEWKVRAPLPKTLQGDLLTYLSDTASSGTVIFASKKLNGLIGDSSCALIRQPDGSYSGGIEASLVRINPETYDKRYLDYYKSQLTYVKKIVPYEYYLRKQTKDPPVTCLTGHHEEYNSTEQSISEQLNASFEKLEAY